jgi:hypothetical protein
VSAVMYERREGSKRVAVRIGPMVTAIRLVIAGLHGSVPPRIQLPAAPATPPWGLIRRNYIVT